VSPWLAHASCHHSVIFCTGAYPYNADVGINVIFTSTNNTEAVDPEGRPVPSLSCFQRVVQRRTILPFRSLAITARDERTWAGALFFLLRFSRKYERCADQLNRRIMIALVSGIVRLQSAVGVARPYAHLSHYLV
jgi:hypothetical protein